MKRVCWVAVPLLALTAFGRTAQSEWDVFGSFGRVEGVVLEDGSDGFSLTTNGYRIVTSTTTDRHGVSVRKTVFRNVSAASLTVNCLLDRFSFEGGDCEVYTQASTWSWENRGAWQKLNTSVVVRNPHMRSCSSATPMLAIWNERTRRGRVFHLLTDGAWEMHATCTADGGGALVCVEAGLDSRHLNWRLGPGEEIALPEIVSYEFANRVDLDCHKLHAFWNERHPASRRQPTIYNSWLCRFDRFDADMMLKQVDVAKEMGVDYFVLDAGWFGRKARWTEVRGDWEERADGALGGRMAEISDAVRKAGLKFGFWIEAESAVRGARVVQEHPDWFVTRGGSIFLDFTNPKAFAGLADTLCRQIKRYKAEFLKFDFNQDADYDPEGKAFVAYNAAYRQFIREIRRRNPGIYIEGCASGGLMMDLGWARDYDSFWFTDNQSPYHGLWNLKNAMLRLPPRMIERWITARTLQNVQPDYNGKDSRLVATDDACWLGLRTVSPEYLSCFAAGGPIGFSCDLTAFSDGDRSRLADMVSAHRRDCEFWNRAVGRILCDTPTTLALQYSDEALTDVRLAVVSENALNRKTTVFPALDPSATYETDGGTRTAADIAAHGIVVPVRDIAAREVRLRKVPSAR